MSNAWSIAKGAARDLHENMGSTMQPIRSKLRHIQLDVDVTLMSPKVQREALAVLLDSVAMTTME